MAKVMITGSDGFIGKYLHQKLPGCNVVAFDANDGDIVEHKFSESEVVHVFHLAAKTSVPDSWENPREFYRVNVLGTTNILEYCRRIGASMTYVNSYPYGIPLYNPIDEAHPCIPHSVYNHSKHLAEDICRFYAAHYNVPITVFRLFNVFGGGQRTNFLIPHIVKQALFSSHIEVMDLAPKRDYTYIADVVEAIRLSIGLKGFNEYNVGSGESKSVGEICNHVLTILCDQKPILSLDNKRKNEVPDIIADISKINNELGWKPTTSFDEGLRNTIHYYQQERGKI